jgi:hypothetical protein
LMLVLNEAKVLGWETSTGKPTVQCKVYEDIGALKMAKLPKMHFQTKRLSIRMHHFRDHVRSGYISLERVAQRVSLPTY